MFFLVDYSLSDLMVPGEPPVGGIRSGKFVQIRKGNDEYLVLASRESATYHADIVERFCAERGLSGSYDRGRKRFDFEVPGWVVEGGGKFDIDDRTRRIRLYDQSTAYGKFSSEGLEEKLGSTAEVRGYTVHLG